MSSPSTQTSIPAIDAGVGSIIVVHATNPGDANIVFRVGAHDTDAIVVSTAGAERLAEALLVRAGYAEGKLVLHEQSELIARALHVYLTELNRVRVVEERVLPPDAQDAMRVEADAARELRDQLNGMTR